MDQPAAALFAAVNPGGRAQGRRARPAGGGAPRARQSIRELAVLLVPVGASLDLRASQATLRATNGNGDVYSTSGALVAAANRAAPGPGSGSNPLRADACGDGEVRCFSPVLYAIDTVVPLSDRLGTPDPYVPGGQLMLWWLNLATLLGWLLSSIFVLSLARLSRSP